MFVEIAADVFADSIPCMGNAELSECTGEALFLELSVTPLQTLCFLLSLWSYFRSRSSCEVGEPTSPIHCAWSAFLR